MYAIKARPARMLIILLILLLVATACSEGPAFAPTATPVEPPAASPPAAEEILTLPAAFHYELALRSVTGGEDAPTTITGAYRDGALAQTTRQGDGSAEQLIIVADPADGVRRSFTRPWGGDRWSRWPGVSFDVLYGLASPFSPLRLYPLVSAQNTAAEPDPLSDVPAETFRIQVVFASEVIERLLQAGVAAMTPGAEQREALTLQLAPLFVPQTVTYWASADGQVYRAAATLMTSAPAGQPLPWLEATWRYWGYDDPAIAIAAPAAFEDVTELALQPGAETSTPAGETPLAPDTTLRVRVFANPGLPAADAQVIVYPTGKKQALATQRSADAQFALPGGVYDVFVQAEAAWKWLRDIAVATGTVSSHDVVFAFGTLTLIVTHEGTTPQVDIVVYPAGQRQEWLDWRTENPTALRLPEGTYDVEVALPDLSATKRVTGIEVKANQTMEVTIDLDAP